MTLLSPEISRWIRSRRQIFAGVIAVLLVAGIAWIYQFRPQLEPAKQQLTSRSGEVDFSFASPLPLSIELDPAKLAIGARLFHDPRLSADNTISCASCHNLASGGVDNRARSIGVKNGVGSVNAPTVFNSGLNFVQFWDGRAPTLEAQAEGPITHPLEMASTWAMVIKKLREDPIYPVEFKKLYSDGMTPGNIKNAIAIFERSLITPNSRFDKFLRGDSSALTAQEKNGYALFQSYGCSSCHQGVNLGGNMFEKMGLMGDYFADRGNVTEADKGRFNITHNPDNMYEFRVPSLRNVALTAPYFHDGGAKSLKEAIRVMAKYQLGRSIPLADEESIEAFLKSLTGEYQGKPL